MRHLRGLAGLWLLSSAATAIKFVNPPAPGDAGDYSQNPVYVVGSSVEVLWADSKEGEKVSVVVWQEDIGGGTGGRQILIENTVDTTSYSWTVATKFDLARSNVFFMALHTGGKVSGGFQASSHYFNLTQPESRNPPPTTAETTSTSTSTTSTTSTTSSTSTTGGSSPTPGFGELDDTSSDSDSSNTDGSNGSNNSNNSNNADPNFNSNSSNDSADSSTSSNSNSSPETQETATGSSSSSGLSTPAAIGIGVSIPCALILGAAAGYLLFRRHKANAAAAAAAAAAPPYQGNWAETGEEHSHTPPPPVAVNYHPVELDEPRKMAELPASWR